jgi:hypothetical protein
LREKEKADRAAEQTSRAGARRTYQRLKQALKISQKGKKHSLKPPARAILKKRAVVRPTAHGEPQGAVAAAPTIQSRRGRAINTPKKFL